MSKRIDVSRAPVVIVATDEPNPHNPYSSATAEEREAALAEVVRRTMFRRCGSEVHGGDGRKMDETTDDSA